MATPQQQQKSSLDVYNISILSRLNPPVSLSQQTHACDNAPRVDGRAGMRVHGWRSAQHLVQRVWLAGALVAGA